MTPIVTTISESRGVGIATVEDTSSEECIRATDMELISVQDTSVSTDVEETSDLADKAETDLAVKAETDLADKVETDLVDKVETILVDKVETKATSAAVATLADKAETASHVQAADPTLVQALTTPI